MADLQATRSPDGSGLGFETGDLAIALTLEPDGSVLTDFYRGYDDAFVLADEKEELRGFQDCLALNFGAERERLGALYGDYYEAVLVARNRSGAMVGGANFICFPLHDATTAQDVIAMNLNYIFVEPAQRRKGYLQKLLEAARIAARKLCCARNGTDGRPVLIFLEQNDPVRMHAQAYAHDTAHSGLDQRQRIGIWARLGARIVDYPYVQPPLSDGQAADIALVYALIGAPWPRLPACLLRDHLQRFFGISVRKGRPLAQDVIAQGQIDDLTQRCAKNATLRLLDPTQWAQDSSTDFRPGTTSLRDILR